MAKKKRSEPGRSRGLARLLGRRGRADRPVVYDTFPLKKRLIQLPVLALLLTLVVELLNRKLSPVRLGLFLWNHPVIFLYNALIVLTSLVLSEFFKRRRAVLATVSVFWVVLGVVQYIVDKERTQPFAFADILNLKEAISLMPRYFSVLQIILIFGGGFALIFLVILLYARTRRRERVNRPMALAALIGSVLLCFMIAVLGVRAGTLPQRFETPADDFGEYGFPVSFAFSVFQQGVSRQDSDTVNEVIAVLEEDPAPQGIARPASYSGEALKNIINGISTFSASDDLAHPNIVVVQLESFFDVNTIIGAEYSADPTPNFNRLSKAWPSGLLYVPTIGGGTVNTEFEILTGMNLEDFGVGEYPYNSVLRETTAESLAYNVKNYGYTATAMHNNRATFYGRNVVYPRLGFDRFVPLEYMQNIHYNDREWACDDALTDEILSALTTTEGRDLVFCVAVESHGPYRDVYDYKDGDIKVYEAPEAIPLERFQNFVNILPASDAFLGDVIARLEQFEEPTLAVIYGDHLPGLALEGDMLTTGSVYASRYILWNNYGASFDAPDLQAYRLTDNVLKQLGMTGGYITRLNQSVGATVTDEEYLARLEALEYDMLYGDKLAYGGESPYAPTDMTMGSRPVTITDAALGYHRLLVTGSEFTEYSAVIANEQVIDALFIDPQHIIAPIEDGVDVSDFCVAQVTEDGDVLGRSEIFYLE